MEIADVRRRVHDTIERAKRAAAERRGRVDAAARDYEAFLERVATPVFRQVVSVLRSEGYPFTVNTPGGSVRLTSDRNQQDFIEVTLDSSEGEPRVLGHSTRVRGRRVLELERPIADGLAIADLTEQDVLEFVLKELAPFVER